jgi:hypothetical protein
MKFYHKYWLSITINKRERDKKRTNGLKLTCEYYASSPVTFNGKYPFIMMMIDIFSLDTVSINL